MLPRVTAHYHFSLVIACYRLLAPLALAIDYITAIKKQRI